MRCRKYEFVQAKLDISVLEHYRLLTGSCLFTGPRQKINKNKNPPKRVFGSSLKCKSMGFFYQFYHPKNVNGVEELHAEVLYLWLRI